MGGLCSKYAISWVINLPFISCAINLQKKIVENCACGIVHRLFRNAIVSWLLLTSNNFLSECKKLSFDTRATLLLIPTNVKYISTHDERNKKLKQTKYFIQYLKKLQFRNNKYNFKYCHNITCYLIMMIQNGWLNVFENFQLLWCQDLLIKYAVADSWSISFQQCPKSVFRGEHGVRGHDNGHNDAQRVFRRNQQLMPSIPKSYVWSITNTLNIIRMLFSVSTSSNNNIQKIYIGYTKYLI